MTSTLRALGLVSLLGLAAAASGCGSTTGDYCDAQCACEGCSDNQLEQCVVEQDARLDQADVYGCADLRDAYLQCVVDHPLCEVAAFHVSPSCTAAKDRSDNCATGRDIRIDLRGP